MVDKSFMHYNSGVKISRAGVDQILHALQLCVSLDMANFIRNMADLPSPL